MAALLALAAACAAGPEEARAQATPVPPAAPPAAGRLSPPSDAEWAALVLALSEEGGFFDTDNLISNEGSYLHAVGPLRARAGGAYLGVGPGQNLSYVAAARPDVAFLVDIRRDNLLQHLLLRALLRLSEHRAGFLARLHGRALPPVEGGWEGRPLAEILDRIAALPVDRDALSATSAGIRTVLGALPLPLSDDDLATIARFHGEFVRHGPALRFQTFGRPPRPCYPTYRQLLLETDASGRPASWLATEDDFRRVQALSAQNRIVPVVGDLAGTHAVRAIAAWLDEREVDVAAYYTSNVEDYLWRDGSYARFLANVAALPWRRDGVVVRSYFGFSPLLPRPPQPTTPGALAYCSVQVVQPARALLDAAAAYGARGPYERIISAGALDLR